MVPFVPALDEAWTARRHPAHQPLAQPLRARCSSVGAVKTVFMAPSVEAKHRAHKERDIPSSGDARPPLSRWPTTPHPPKPQASMPWRQAHLSQYAAPGVPALRKQTPTHGRRTWPWCVRSSAPQVCLSLGRLSRKSAFSPDGKGHKAIIYIANRAHRQNPVYRNFTEASTRGDACARA